MPSEIKYFTPGEARKTLPLVKNIVGDILAQGKKLRELIGELEDEDLENYPTVKEIGGQLRGYLMELQEIGCFYKDWNFSIGLVDFPSVINNEEVLLCWRSDEDDIKYYHNMEEGFAGRKPIPEDYL